MGLIRSKLNDFVFDGSGSDIVMQPYEPSNAHRSWVLNGAAVSKLADPKVVLDVKGEKCDNCANICAYQNRGAAHQKWSIVYV